MSDPSSTGVVLIHGGLHTAWCWHRVTTLLDLPSLTLDLAGRGTRATNLASLRMRDVIDAAAAELESTGWDTVVLVAHSFGGVTALGLGALMPDRIAHMVFISAVTPKPGRRPVDELPAPVRWFAETAMRNQSRRPDGAFTLPKSVAKRMFCSDLDADDTAAVIGHLVPDTPALVLDPVPPTGIPNGIGRTYVRLSKDRGLKPRQQDKMIANIAPVDVIDVRAGHNVILSQPAVCAALINRLCARVGSSVSDPAQADTAAHE